MTTYLKATEDKPAQEPVTVTRDEADTRLKLAQAEWAEMKNARERGENLPVDAVFSILESVVMNYRSKLLGLSGKLSPQLAGKAEGAVKEILDGAVDETLTELSRLRPEDFTSELERNMAEAGAGDSDDGPTAKADRVGVGGRRKKAVAGNVGGAGPVEDK